MNDEMRERLSAYLDGALSESERLAVEAQLARSEDMRLELEALRAVSASVKGLGRQPLPPGFLARLESRRQREDAKPARTWVFLPPAARPFAFALSTAVVALVVWDHSHPSTDVLPPIGWDGGKVPIKTAAEAPATQADLSARISAGEPAKGLGFASQQAAKENEEQASAGNRVADAKLAKTLGQHVDAPGKPVEFVETDRLAAAGAGGAKSESAPAAAPAPAGPAADAAPEGSSFRATSEEERSAINEKLYQGFEAEKKKMGIARIIEKDADKDAREEAAAETMPLTVPPSAPAVARKRAPTLGGAASRGQAFGALQAKADVQEPASSPLPPAPAPRAIPLKSAEALQAAWATAGLAGDPPAVDFPAKMAVFLACPSGCGISSVYEGKKTVTVFYKLEGFSSPTARVAAVPASGKRLIVKPQP